MRVLFVLEYFPPHVGGVETLFDNLTKKLAERGDEVTVLTSRMPGVPNIEESDGRQIHRISPPSRTSFILSYPKISGPAKEADVIHTTTYAGAIATKFANRSAKRPVVATFHEVIGKAFFSMENPVSAALHYSLESLICRAYKNDVLTCPSEATKRSMTAKGIPAGNIRVIPHGIDHGVFNTAAKPSMKFGGPAYLCMGRAGVSKGVEYLADAVPAIAEAVPNSKLVLMLSKKDNYNKIVSRVKKLGVTDNVIFLEPRKNAAEVAGVLRSCDVVVVPSLSEGFGFNAVEAQACGVPVVATTAGSLPEVVKGGTLVPPKDSAAIARAVIKMLKDRGLAKELGSAGSRHAKTFTWERAVKEYLRLYSSAAR
jgi:glycosyltransferase involved in cell wall biosynthesis